MRIYPSASHSRLASGLSPRFAEPLNANSFTITKFAWLKITALTQNPKNATLQPLLVGKPADAIVGRETYSLAVQVNKSFPTAIGFNWLYGWPISFAALWSGFFFRTNMKRQNAGKTPKADASTPTIEAPVEWSGHMTAGNQWFKIGLAKEEVSALKDIRNRLWPKRNEVKLADVLRMLAVAAMVHCKVIEPHLFNDSDYARKEGYCGTQQYHSELLRAKFPGTRQYRKKNAD